MYLLIVDKYKRNISENKLKIKKIYYLLKKKTINH